jgi:hypothetical protein
MKKYCKQAMREMRRFYKPKKKFCWLSAVTGGVAAIGVLALIVAVLEAIENRRDGTFFDDDDYEFEDLPDWEPEAGATGNDE